MSYKNFEEDKSTLEVLEHITSNIEDNINNCEYIIQEKKKELMDYKHQLSKLNKIIKPIEKKVKEQEQKDYEPTGLMADRY